MNSTYNAVSKVRAGHAIPHLLWSSSAGLYVSDPTFDILNTAYLISLLPLPLFIGLVGLLFVFVFIIAIVLRLLLLTCKFLVRKCPGAEACRLFRCCVCCRKGCTHPESRCSKCCCCHRAVTAISRERAETTLTTKIHRHNTKRERILEVHSVILVLLLVSDGMVFYGQQEISIALEHIVKAITVVKGIFSGVVDAALFVVESLDTTSMKHHSLWAAMLIGAFVISASDFSAACGVRRAVLKFTAAVKFWRRVFITDMFKKKHPKLVELVCKMSQKADSQWEVLDTLEAINAEWRSAQK
jgi:hypothetical protein